MANLFSEIASVDCKQDKGTEALVVTSVLLSIATVTVALRLYIRIFMRRSLGWDDYFIVASLATGVTAFALYVKLIASGMGRHLICLNLQDISEVAKWSLFAQILIVCTLGLTKVSVCIFVIRMVDKAQRRFTLCLWALITFITISHLVQIILFLVQCRPIEAVWDILVQGDCFSTRVTYISAWVNYSLDASADLLCVGIATYIIQRLQMNIQTKIALCVLMALGLFTAACVVVDAVTLQGVFETDTTWAITQPAMWAGIGSFVGITIASVPVLKPLFSKVFAIVTLHSSSGSSKRSFRKVIAGAPVVQVQCSAPANIKNSTRRHDLESYNTDVTLTQNSNSTIVEQMDEPSIPPLAHYP